jgi:lipopolysaccharide transport system ATP-binding protein
MTDSAISLRNVSKCYSSWRNPSERLLNLFGRPASPDSFWAVRDVSLEIPKGGAVGFVGVNGAGKSTLLQMIAGTVQPTSGMVEVNGRVSPLLELGAGFNFDYTGWENAELAGAVLGLSAKELNRKLGSIAAFADIGPFMNSPVKTYSSGMFARLAFAVAVHVDPEILLVDEILSVGDMGFQQRCLVRLREMRERGLTLLFVSHGPDAIKSVCNHAAFMHQGQLVDFGEADRIVDHYLAFIRERANKEVLDQEAALAATADTAPRTEIAATNRYGSGHVQIVKVDVCDETGKPGRAFKLGAPVAIRVKVSSSIEVSNLSVSFLVRDSTGVDIMGTTTFDEHINIGPLDANGMLDVEFCFVNWLRPGSYGISVAVCRVSRRDYTDNLLFDQADGVASFLVTEDPARPVHYKVHQPVEISLAHT